jgi:hypothetical protein
LGIKVNKRGWNRKQVVEGDHPLRDSETTIAPFELGIGISVLGSGEIKAQCKEISVSGQDIRR